MNMFDAATKDGPQVTPDWTPVGSDPIDGVSITEVKHVMRDHGVLTENYRTEWDPTGLPVVQLYQSRLYPGAIGAWSCHMRSIDRLFVASGHIKAVLYDGRSDSPSYGRVNEFHLGDGRPAFVVLPTGVWHGLQNLGTTDAIVLNLPTLAYQYDDPDHYRLPLDSPEIPYRFDESQGSRSRRNP